MDHLPYPKMGSVAPVDLLAPGGTWVLLEKIHGAQLVVCADASEATTRFGKRKAWLAADDPFFGWQVLRCDLDESVRRALHWARVSRIRLYGEIFGGGYPGEGAVQTGVWYSPDVRFAVFDALIDDRDFIAHRDLEQLAAAAGLMVAPLIARGSRTSLDAYPVRFQTRVPTMLGLSPLEGNVAEGFVKKPDAAMGFLERYAVKRKIPEFDEQVYDESTPGDAMLDLEALTALGLRMVNAARLASARSKCGDADAAAVADEAVLDVLSDLESAYLGAVRALDPAGESLLHAALRVEALRMLDRR